jgi:hypothetical protein
MKTAWKYMDIAVDRFQYVLFSLCTGTVPTRVADPLNFGPDPDPAIEDRPDPDPDLT